MHNIISADCISMHNVSTMHAQWQHVQLFAQCQHIACTISGACIHNISASDVAIYVSACMQTKHWHCACMHWHCMHAACMYYVSACMQIPLHACACMHWHCACMHYVSACMQISLHACRFLCMHVHACTYIVHACSMHAHACACMHYVSACMQILLHACRHACRFLCMHAACMQHACCMHAQFRRADMQVNVALTFKLIYTHADTISKTLQQSWIVHVVKIFQVILMMQNIRIQITLEEIWTLDMKLGNGKIVELV